MKITTNEGEFELVEFCGDVPEESTSQETTLKPTRLYALKPVKKTEKKNYHVVLNDFEDDVILDTETGEITSETAHKLAEAISALEEYVTSEEGYSYYIEKANAARESYRNE